MKRPLISHYPFRRLVVDVLQGGSCLLFAGAAGCPWSHGLTRSATPRGAPYRTGPRHDESWSRRSRVLGVASRWGGRYLFPHLSSTDHHDVGF